MALILVAMAGIVYFKESSVEKKVSDNIEKESIKLFENFDAASINSVTLKNNRKNETVTFEKSGDDWIVKDKACRADKNSINRIIETLPKIRLGRDMGEWKDSHQLEHGFNEGIEITVEGKTFSFGSSKGVSTPLKYENSLYFSPFRERHVFEKHDGNWCEKVEEKKPDEDSVK